MRIKDVRVEFRVKEWGLGVSEWGLGVIEWGLGAIECVYHYI